MKEKIMLRYKVILIAAVLAAFMFGMVLTPSAFAFLAIDTHIAKEISG